MHSVTSVLDSQLTDADPDPGGGIANWKNKSMDPFANFYLVGTVFYYWGF